MCVRVCVILQQLLYAINCPYLAIGRRQTSPFNFQAHHANKKVSFLCHRG